MVGHGRRRQVDRSRWRQFLTVGEHFGRAADMAAGSEYWNAAGVLIVHAAVAMTDAITVRVGAIKHTGEDHGAAADLLGEVLAIDADGKRAIAHLRAILEEKTLVSYSGHVYRREDVGRMSRHLARYQAWAGRYLVP